MMANNKKADSSQLLDLTNYKKESNYIYDKNGRLVHKKDNSKFIFTNKVDYENIANYVTAYVKSNILNKYKMDEIWVPNAKKILRQFSFKPDNSIPQANIYISQDFLTNEKKLLCLIQGTGMVKAGIWSRAVCINDCVQNGSVLPYLDLAKRNDMAVIIFNPNERSDPRNNKEIHMFSTMEKHCHYVWENVVEKFSKAKEIYFVSHSMGGYCTVDIFKNFRIISFNTFENKVKKVAFTDSVHGLRPRILKKSTLNHLVKTSINFVKSKAPLGDFLADNIRSPDFVYNLSAGHDLHEYTTGTAFPEIEKFFFDDNYLEAKIIEHNEKTKK